MNGVTLKMGYTVFCSDTKHIVSEVNSQKKKKVRTLNKCEPNN